MDLMQLPAAVAFRGPIAYIRNASCIPKNPFVEEMLRVWHPEGPLDPEAVARTCNSTYTFCVSPACNEILEVPDIEVETAQDIASALAWFLTDASSSEEIPEDLRGGLVTFACSFGSEAQRFLAIMAPEDLEEPEEPDAETDADDDDDATEDHAHSESDVTEAASADEHSTIEEAKEADAAAAADADAAAEEDTEVDDSSVRVYVVQRTPRDGTAPLRLSTSFLAHASDAERLFRELVADPTAGSD